MRQIDLEVVQIPVEEVLVAVRIEYGRADAGQKRTGIGVRRSEEKKDSNLFRTN